MNFKFLFILIFLCISSSIFSQEKTILKIAFSGNKKTSTKYLIKVVQSKPGVKIDSLAFEKDLKKLKRLPAISHASYQIIHLKNNSYLLQFNLEENFTIIPVVNFWSNNKSKVAYKVGVYDYNFLGKNIGFGGFYQNNGHNTYALNFRAPHLFSNKIGLAINHQNWKSEEPLYFNKGVAQYTYNNVSFEVLGLFETDSKNSFEFGFNFFKEKYNYVKGITSSKIPLNLNLNKILLKFIYTHDNLKYHYQYINGFKSQFYGQIVKSKQQNQENFYIAWNDFFYYKRVGTKGNWANRIRAGLASNNETPFAPFSLDNNVNLRGVGILVDRGTGSIVLNSEYRLTIFEKKWFSLQGNAFIDAGSWRNPGGKLNDFVNHKNIQLFSGVGLRFIHKKIFNAILRIDYGQSLKDNSKRGFVFGVGQYF